MLKRLLEERGFTVMLGSYPEIGYYVVDFHDPDVEREMVEAFAPYDRGRAELFARDTSRGSVAFYEKRTEGEMPMVAMRRPGAKGMLWESVTPPPEMKVTTVHLRGYDSLVSVHLHFEGVTEYADQIVRLADFIAKVRDAVKTFIR